MLTRPPSQTRPNPILRVIPLDSSRRENAIRPILRVSVSDKRRSRKLNELCQVKFGCASKAGFFGQIGAGGKYQVVRTRQDKLQIRIKLMPNHRREVIGGRD